MTDQPAAPPSPELDNLPEPVVRRRARVKPSMIWLVPIIAAIAGALLILRSFMATGPTITISFKTAEGLDAGKTEVRYKDVVLGKVKAMEMSEDRSHVVATVNRALSTLRGAITTVCTMPMVR